jgi:phage terminase large subunit GpA-like protein
MMRGGVWVPEGCTVDDKRADAAVANSRQRGRPRWGGFSDDSPWLVGTPARDGSIWSSHLSSLYALSLTWGKLAEQIVWSELSPETRRNTINGWWAETFEFARREQTWEQLGERLMAPFEVARGVLPPGYRLLTAGVDKQEDRYVVNVDAWAAGKTSHTADYFECDDEEELLAALGEDYVSADGRKLKICLTLLDSGFRPKEVWALVDRAKKRNIAIIPCRGSTHSLGPGVLYKKKRLGKETARPGAPYVLVDTTNSQDWIDRQLHELFPGKPGGTSLFRAELGEQQDYLEQLLNEGPEEGAWHVIDENVPVDYRDAKRYAAVAMLLKTRGKEIRSDEAQSPKSKVQSPKDESKRRQRRGRDATSPLRRPGGWLNMP